MPVFNMNIVRIAELEAIPVTILRDKNNLLWGVLEAEDKVYKFDLREILALLDARDPRCDDLLVRMAKLEKAYSSLVLGMDENVVIEP